MLKHIGVIIILTLIGIVVQASFIHALSPAAVAPDIFVVLSVYLALQHRTPKGAVCAFFLGVVADFASGQFLGPNAAGCVAAFFVAGTISERVYVERGLAMVLTVALAAIAKSLTFVTMLAFFVGVNILTSEMIKTIALEAVFSAMIAPVVMWMLTKQPRRAGAPSMLRKQRLGWS